VKGVLGTRRAGGILSNSYSDEMNINLCGWSIYARGCLETLYDGFSKHRDEMIHCAKHFSTVKMPGRI